MSKAIPRGDGKKYPPTVEMEDLLTILAGGCPRGWTVTVVQDGHETVTKLCTGEDGASEA